MTGGKIEIGGIDISPFNQVILNDITIDDPEGDRVLEVDELGAGINVWKLVTKFRIEFTFAEVIGMKARIYQPAKDSPLNIQFLIDAFKSKDKKKEPAKFDLEINNIVIRQCEFTFDRLWIPPQNDKNKIDFNHLKISSLSADLRLPILKNDNYEIDLRRLSFKEVSGLNVNSVSGLFKISPSSIAFKNLEILLGNSDLKINDMDFKIRGFKDLKNQILANPINLFLSNNRITPADFSSFLPVLKEFNQPLHFSLNADLDENQIQINGFDLKSDLGLSFSTMGIISGLKNSSSHKYIALSKIDLEASSIAIATILSKVAGLNPDLEDFLARVGDLSLKGRLELSPKSGYFKGKTLTSLGNIDLDIKADGVFAANKHILGTLTTPGIDLGVLANNSDFGMIEADADFDVKINRRAITGFVETSIPRVDYKGYSYSNLVASVTKNGDIVEGEISADDDNLTFNISGVADISGKTYNANLLADITKLNLSELNLVTNDRDMTLSGEFSVDATGSDINNSDISLLFSGINYYDNVYGEITMDELSVDYVHSQSPNSLKIACDYLTFDMDGEFELNHLKDTFLSILSKPFPDLIPPPGDIANNHSNECFDYKLRVYNDSELIRKLKLPVKIFEPIEVSGNINSREGIINLQSNIPYLLQGKNKIIKDTNLSLNVDTTSNLCNLAFSTRVVNNKGDISLMVDANAANGTIDSDVAWLFDRPKAYSGNIKLNIGIETTERTSPLINIHVNPSSFQVADTLWNVDSGLITYCDKTITVDKIKVHRDNQYVKLSGTSSPNPDDAIRVDLKHIDLDYVFDVLNINYVTFGGNATGAVFASEVISPNPRLYTDSLTVRKFTYNGAMLGDAFIKSYWNNTDRSVKILADVKEGKALRAKVNGDIWVNKDSLSFDFDADKLNIALMKPFVAAFSSDLTGRGSGKVKLYGTFKDINMTGKVYANNLRMKIDLTNTVYTVSDSVFMTPGKISIPKATLYDRDGHTAQLSGEILHNYFHEPRFDFKVTGAKDFLCYDTKAGDNEIWYGTIYGNGSGKITGVPGFIDVLVDMTIAPRSTFTFVLDDREEAIDYDFLTFTDKAKSNRELLVTEHLENESKMPDYISQYISQQQMEQSIPTRYKIDLRITATPDGEMNLIMDPIAGDRIKAVGNGSLRIGYNSEGDLSMYGTYTLLKGSYNFTLQDLIVRDFKIREGSKITFTGNPLDANLDIAAAYRVNTNLRDLDKSFASDKDLNRTNVPVEAILKVSGNMNHPDINFDIELPTLTQDVVRKVKSIISTSDMMNRQIIYLLALSRFYTPDYMSTTSNNNELASVASTTISTQLSSMLGQLTNNWSFMPNIRTDKGDFSDTEVDLALSSTLLNNRLLFNGNFGYRDRSTSSTSFIGDFDIEYLLNPQGTLRLKAYNHFNDQNYYLKSALTTQGIGIVFKHDFNDMFKFLRRNRKKEEQQPTDTLQQNIIQ